MSCPCSKQRGGKVCQKGAGGAPLSYVNPGYQEPSASQGSNRLGSESLLARPGLNHTGGKRRTRKSTRSRSKTRSKRTKKTSCKSRKQRGGFYPSVMGSLLYNGARLIPAAIVQAYYMMRNYKPKSRRRK
jgi:hypothetical protein